MRLLSQTLLFMKTLFLISCTLMLLLLSIDVQAQTSQPQTEPDSMQLVLQDLKTQIDSLKKALAIVENPFKISVGASFDFFSGASATDLYYDVNFFLPSLWDEEKHGKGWSRIGIDFMFYQARLFGDSTTLNLPQRPRRFGMDQDTVLAESYTLNRFRQTTIENTGIYINPTFKLKDHLYAFAIFESVLQRETVTFNDQFSDIDSTLRILNTEYEAPLKAL